MDSIKDKPKGSGPKCSKPIRAIYIDPETNKRYRTSIVPVYSTWPNYDLPKNYYGAERYARIWDVQWKDLPLLPDSQTGDIMN